MRGAPEPIDRLDNATVRNVSIDGISLINRSDPTNEIDCA